MTVQEVLASDHSSCAFVLWKGVCWKCHTNPKMSSQRTSSFNIIFKVFRLCTAGLQSIGFQKKYTDAAGKVNIRYEEIYRSLFFTAIIDSGSESMIHAVKSFNFVSVAESRRCIIRSLNQRIKHEYN